MKLIAILFAIFALFAVLGNAQFETTTKSGINSTTEFSKSTTVSGEEATGDGEPEDAQGDDAEEDGPPGDAPPPEEEPPEYAAPDEGEGGEPPSEE